MKFPLSWLREWVDYGVDDETLIERVTAAGLEVDSLTLTGTDLDGVVVAEVVAAKPHPDADRLTLCEVSVGNGNPIQVVCGAPNVRVGLRTPYAPPGTRLPSGMKLRRARIRGVESQGMLCSAAELELGAEADGIMELGEDAPIGADLAVSLSLPDAIVDIDITPNRGDCFSVLGIARDVAALTEQVLAGPELAPADVVTDTVQAVERPVPEACPRFAHQVVEGIDPQAQTPLWMRERLRRSGLRPIHPVVDVTNYVMLEVGQPLHAYDRDRLQGAVRPRYAENGERLVLLDEREVELGLDTVVITDDSGVIGMAGIMGGLSTMVTDQTTNVFFEAAFWPPEVMAGKARTYAMHTDASVRFERGVDPEGQARAVSRAAGLLVGIAGGRAGPLIDDVDAELLPARGEITLTSARIRQVLGTDIPASSVDTILRGLEMTVAGDDPVWKVTPPSHRFDIVQEDDLVEEIARIFSYDRLPEITAKVELPLEAMTETRLQVDDLADLLAARDYAEVITYSFVDEKLDEAISGNSGQLKLSNPISSAMSVMRSSLWSGLLEAAAANVARQQSRVRLFEIGKTFHGKPEAPVEVARIAGLVLGERTDEPWDGTAQTVDFFDLKRDVEALVSMTGCATEFSFEGVQDPALQPGQSARLLRNGEPVGHLGKLHPRVGELVELRNDAFLFELDIDKAFIAHVPVASPVSRYPAVRRDIAVVVDEGVTAAQLVEAVRSTAPALIREVRVFDVYRGKGIEDGLKSIALGLILQETSRTLTDDDADQAIASAIQKVKQEFDAELRD